MSAPNLWAVYISGPDFYAAAPNESTAKHMATALNTSVNLMDWGFPAICATAVEWPFGSQDHAEQIENFDYAAWGLKNEAAS